MAFRLELESGEKLTLQIAFKASKNDIFNFAVSDRALYWPARKMFVMKGDPTYFKRIRNDEILEVCVRRLPPYGLWLAAVFMILIGSAITILMLAPLVEHEPGKHQVSGWPFAIVVGGLLMPFAAKGRLRFEVRTQRDVFRWKSQLVFDQASKEKIRTTFETIATACKESGLRVTQI
jgi:hypothetical protein